MPYRRLPNTDQARLRALKAAVLKVNTVESSSLAFSQKMALEVVSFMPIFEQVVQQYVDSKEKQSAASRQVAESGRVARLYVSHFIQVFNMCIARGEIKPEARALLGLDVCGNNVPDLTTDVQLVEWGARVVAGEENRMGQGASCRIYNPSIALVKVKQQIFEEHYNRHRDLLQTSQKYHEKLDDVREKADAIILQIWNEVEATFAPVDSDAKRALCQDYGLVYFYRPQERQKDFLLGQSNA